MYLFLLQKVKKKKTQHKNNNNKISFPTLTEMSTT